MLFTCELPRPLRMRKVYSEDPVGADHRSPRSLQYTTWRHCCSHWRRLDTHPALEAWHFNQVGGKGHICQEQL